MTLLYADGFEFYSNVSVVSEMNAAGWNSAANLQIVTGRIAGRAIAGSGTQPTILYTMVTTSAAYMGFARIGAVSTSAILCGFRDTTGAIAGPFTLAQEPGNKLTTFVGGVTVSSTPNDIWPSDTAWRSVVVSVNSNNTTGSYKVMLEGVTVLQATGIDTAVSTQGIFTRAFIVVPQPNGAYDDFYVGNSQGSAPYNANLGDCRYEVIRPISDVSVAFVRSTATVGNWICVADVSTSVSSFVETSVVGARDTYGMGNMSGIPVTVYAVIPQMYHQKLDAGTLNLRFYTEVAGVTTIGSNFSPLVSAYRWSQEVMITQPNGTAWDTTAVNALIAGVETA